MSAIFVSNPNKRAEAWVLKLPRKSRGAPINISLKKITISSQDYTNLLEQARTFADEKASYISGLHCALILSVGDLPTIGDGIDVLAGRFMPPTDPSTNMFHVYLAFKGQVWHALIDENLSTGTAVRVDKFNAELPEVKKLIKKFLAYIKHLKTNDAHMSRNVSYAVRTKTIKKLKRYLKDKPK